MRVKSMYKKVCSLTKLTMFRSKSTLHNILFYLVVYLLISLKGNLLPCVNYHFVHICLFGCAANHADEAILSMQMRMSLNVEDLA